MCSEIPAIRPCRPPSPQGRGQARPHVHRREAGRGRTQSRLPNFDPWRSRFHPVAKDACRGGGVSREWESADFAACAPTHGARKPQRPNRKPFCLAHELPPLCPLASAALRARLLGLRASPGMSRAQLMRLVRESFCLARKAPGVARKPLPPRAQASPALRARQKGSWPGSGGLRCLPGPTEPAGDIAAPVAAPSPKIPATQGFGPGCEGIVMPAALPSTPSAPFRLA